MPTTKLKPEPSATPLGNDVVVCRRIADLPTQPARTVRLFCNYCGQAVWRQTQALTMDQQWVSVDMTLGVMCTACFAIGIRGGGAAT